MKKNYMLYLSNWAKWLLPWQEAEDVISDYRDIVGIPPRSDEELIRDLGKPWNVVKSVAHPKPYRMWLVAFSALALCVIFPVIMAYKRIYWEPIIRPSYMIFLCIGISLSLRSFRKNGKKEVKLTGGVLLSLVFLLVGIGGIWFFLSLMLTESWEVLNRFVPTTAAAQAMRLLLCLCILSMGLTSLYGLVKARLDDRRWCSVYILGLSGVLLGLFLWLFLCSADLIAESGWQTRLLCEYLLVTFLGLIGTGVALC